MRLMPMAPSPSAPDSTTAAACGAVAVGQGAEEEVDHHVAPAFGQVGQLQLAVLGLQHLARRDHVDMCSASTAARPPPSPPHAGAALQHLGQRALVVGERWITTTKASPVSGGMVVKNSCSASMLPAEPPRPTSGTLR
jgi:hypothetical protein